MAAPAGHRGKRVAGAQRPRGSEDLIIIGEVVGVHGVRGAVRVAPVTDFPDRLLGLAEVVLVSRGAARPVRVERSSRSGRVVLMKFQGTGTRGAAEGIPFGFAKGLGMIIPRVFVGVWDFLSAPFPAPAGFKPILEPEFPWGYFEGEASSPPPPPPPPPRKRTRTH